jgi:hypothetical protein
MSTTPSANGDPRSGPAPRGPASRKPRRTAVAALAALALAGSTAGAALAAPATADTTTADTATTAGTTAVRELPAPHLHYTMDDVAGDVVPDSSGNGLDGAISGTTGLVDAEGGGTALDLPGGSGGGYVTVPRTALEGATDLTVSARVRWDGTGGAWQRVFDLGTDTTRYLFLTPSNGDGVRNR